MEQGLLVEAACSTPSLALCYLQLLKQEEMKPLQEGWLFRKLWSNPRHQASPFTVKEVEVNVATMCIERIPSSGLHYVHLKKTLCLVSPSLMIVRGSRVWLRENNQHYPSTVLSCAEGVVVFRTDYGQTGVMFAFFQPSGISPHLHDLSKVIVSSLALVFTNSLSSPWMHTVMAHGLLDLKFV
ncbi:hypothetical protein DUI87_08133 [Hirundo rustica rustica]|uniref:Myosin X N-terminal SH3 domain-containing protein n=1 Tax=Hirundo rustica rustica TaxID=333673 RepID=A0A3M0L9K6_HIRRU|nr:hypothetical protein DUI87_08133 [Hirundo rustica rustica]